MSRTRFERKPPKGNVCRVCSGHGGHDEQRTNDPRDDRWHRCMTCGGAGRILPERPRDILEHLAIDRRHSRLYRSEIYPMTRRRAMRPVRLPDRSRLERTR